MDLSTNIWRPKSKKLLPQTNVIHFSLLFSLLLLVAFVQLPLAGRMLMVIKSETLSLVMSFESMKKIWECGSQEVSWP